MEIAPILCEIINVINLILEPLIDDSFSKIKFPIDIRYSINVRTTTNYRVILNDCSRSRREN
jgi:hypothetical protein